MQRIYKNIDIRVMVVTTLPFTLLAAVSLVDDPFTWAGFGWKALESFVAILAMWFAVKVISKKMRRAMPKQSQTSIRLTIQMVLSMLAAFGLFLLLGIRPNLMEYHGPDMSYWECVFAMKKILLAMIVFGSLIIMVYESFHLFENLSKSQVDTERYKKESLEAQFQNLKNQINPHFLFNSLNTLATLIEENQDKAQEFVHELSDVYRYVLTSREKDWVELKTELDFVNSFFFLLKMRFEEHLEIDMDVDESYKNYHLPPVSLQLLIENAIKHNIVSSTHQLKIRLYTEGDTLVISNNKKLKKNTGDSTGIGLKNICDRYKYLVNKTVDVIDEDDQFTVKLPLLKIVEG